MPVLIILLIFLLDQASKWWIARHMYLYESTYILPFFNITHVPNKGISFGLLQDIPQLLAAIILVILGFLVYWLLKAQSTFERFAYSLVLGGALGNFVDRLYRGYIIDFLDFHIQSIHFWVFNVADSAITLGVMLLMYYRYRIA